MKGTLYWITGLPGAGKTTLGKMLYKVLEKKSPNIVFYDGDMLRVILAEEENYSLEERRKLSQKYSRFCKSICDQNISIIFATVSMFEDVRDWNRKYIENYIEIYIDVPDKILQQRDQKNLYSDSMEGRRSDLIGVDQKAQFPRNPDIHLINDRPDSLQKLFDTLMTDLKLL